MSSASGQRAATSLSLPRSGDTLSIHQAAVLGAFSLLAPFDLVGALDALAALDRRCPMIRRVLICLTFSLCLTPAGLRAQGVLEVFDDAAFTQRSGTMSEPLKTLYVRFQTDQVSPPGYYGLEFRLSGLEDLVLGNVTWSSPPTLVLGNLSDGINVGYPGCEYDELLLTFTIFSLDPPEDREIQVAAHTQPSNPNYNFPLMSRCDGPCSGCLSPVVGEAYILNPSNVAVESASWRRIKQMYR
jgi:hypothetical protein